MRALPLLLLAGCSGTLPTLDCDGVAISGSVDSGPTDRVIRTTDLVVTGTASSDSLAVRSIEIGNRPATALTTNFATWSATLPVETLVTLADAAGDTDGDGIATVTLSAVATDSCGATWPVGEAFSVQVDLTPDIVVSDLDIDATVPSGKSYVPIDGTAVAALTVSAEASAAGAVVDVSTSLGTTSAPEDGVILGGDGTERASATVLFYADSVDDVGTALITATAEGQIASTTVRIAGPPRISPETLTLTPGQQEVLTVTSDGDIDTCVAYAANTTDITAATSSGTLFGTSASDTDGDGFLEITIEAAESLAAEAELRIRCCDAYDQCTSDATGVYTAAPVGE